MESGVRRAGWMVAVLLMAASCVAQGQHGGGGGFHGSQSSIAISRRDFGAQCGIQDTTDAAAVEYSLNADGEWSAASSATGGAIADYARLWHETNYMVDMHGAPGEGMSSMHSGQMCFDAQGNVTRIADLYMDILRCGCKRLTTFSFAEDGKLTGWEQTFIDLRTGAAVKPPADAEAYPKVWEFHQLEELPFYSLMEKPSGEAGRKE